MRHVILTCKNHPNLRWNCKEIAYTPGKGYNGQRSIFFNGAEDDESLPECPCPPSDLILAPEDPYAPMSEEWQRKAINEAG